MIVTINDFVADSEMMWQIDACIDMTIEKTRIITVTHSVSLYYSTSMVCGTAAVRLVGGSTYGEGRVNIYNDVTQQWMPICGTGWTKTDADVVCRQLGFFAGAAQGLYK